MTALKCPICDKPMKQATYDYDKKDNDDTLYMSIMPCDCICNFAASKAVWQELIRTLKALETLQVFVTKLYLNGNITDEQLERYKRMLVSALEQKDAK